MKRLFRCILIALCVSIANTSFAQSGNWLSDQVMNDMHWRNTLGIDRNGNKIDETWDTKKHPTTAMIYTASTAVKKQTVQGYISRLQSKNPAAAQMVQRNFGSGKYDYNKIYSGLISGTALRTNDATDGVVALLLIGYMIENDINNSKSISKAQIDGLRLQFGPKLRSNTKLRTLDAKARLGEEMKMQVVLLQSGWQAAIKEDTLETYKTNISSLFTNQWNIDLSKLTLTNSGFKAKSESK